MGDLREEALGLRYDNDALRHRMAKLEGALRLCIARLGIDALAAEAKHLACDLLREELVDRRCAGCARWEPVICHEEGAVPGATGRCERRDYTCAGESCEMWKARKGVE